MTGKNPRTKTGRSRSHSSLSFILLFIHIQSLHPLLLYVPFMSSSLSLSLSLFLSLRESLFVDLHLLQPLFFYWLLMLLLSIIICSFFSSLTHDSFWSLIIITVDEGVSREEGNFSSLIPFPSQVSLERSSRSTPNRVVLEQTLYRIFS